MLRLKVKEVAEAQGYSMSSLSRASDISFKTIKLMYRYPQKDVYLSTLEHVADVLGVSICELFEKSSPPSSPH